MHLHSVKNCKPKTSPAYRFAISLIQSSKNKISGNKDFSNLITGLYNLHPQVRQLAPNWDMPLVLLVFTKPPFEPLQEAVLKYS